MGIAILIVLCAAGDFFLVYTFAHFRAESTRTPRRNRSITTSVICANPDPAGFDLVGPLSTATRMDGSCIDSNWIDGNWVVGNWIDGQQMNAESIRGTSNGGRID